MIRTEISADMDFFFPVHVPTITAESERANRIRCAQEDVDAARREYVLRRKQIGMANKAIGWLAKQEKRSAFIMFNKARHAMLRAEKALAQIV